MQDLFGDQPEVKLPAAKKQTKPDKKSVNYRNCETIEICCRVCREFVRNGNKKPDCLKLKVRIEPLYICDLFYFKDRDLPWKN